jgi:hypothetical protein
MILALLFLKFFYSHGDDGGMVNNSEGALNPNLIEAIKQLYGKTYPADEAHVLDFLTQLQQLSGSNRLLTNAYNRPQSPNYLQNVNLRELVPHVLSALKDASSEAVPSKNLLQGLGMLVLAGQKAGYEYKTSTISQATGKIQTPQTTPSSQEPIDVTPQNFLEKLRATVPEGTTDLTVPKKIEEGHGECLALFLGYILIREPTQSILNLPSLITVVDEVTKSPEDDIKQIAEEPNAALNSENPRAPLVKPNLELKILQNQALLCSLLILEVPLQEQAIRKSQLKTVRNFLTSLKTMSISEATALIKAGLISKEYKTALSQGPLDTVPVAPAELSAYLYEVFQTAASGSYEHSIISIVDAIKADFNPTKPFAKRNLAQQAVEHLGNLKERPYSKKAARRKHTLSDLLGPSDFYSGLKEALTQQLNEAPECLNWVPIERIWTQGKKAKLTNSSFVKAYCKLSPEEQAQLSQNQNKGLSTPPPVKLQDDKLYIHREYISMFQDARDRNSSGTHYIQVFKDMALALQEETNTAQILLAQPTLDR